MLKFHSVTLWISLVIRVSYMLLIFQYARRSNMLIASGGEGLLWRTLLLW